MSDSFSPDDPEAAERAIALLKALSDRFAAVAAIEQLAS